MSAGGGGAGGLRGAGPGGRGPPASPRPLSGTAAAREVNYLFLNKKLTMGARAPLFFLFLLY